MSQPGRQRNSASGSDLPIVWEGGDLSRDLYGLCVRDPFIQGEEALLPVMLSQHACAEPWKSLAVLVPRPLMRHVILSFASLGQQSWGRTGMGGMGHS